MNKDKYKNIKDRLESMPEEFKPDYKLNLDKTDIFSRFLKREAWLNLDKKN